MSEIDLQTVKQRFGIIGNSEAMNRALAVAIRVAPTNLSVLVTGESGVGALYLEGLELSLHPFEQWRVYVNW